MRKIIWVAVLLLGCAVAIAQTGTGSSNSTLPSGNSQITNGPVAEYVADSNAVIGWSVPSSSSNMKIKYGSDRDHMNQTADAVPSSDGRNFHARLQSLMPDTRYYFQVIQGSEPVGGVGTFRTVATGAPPSKSKATIPQ